MFSQRTLWFMIILLVLSALACNAVAAVEEPAVPPPPLTGTATVVGEATGSSTDVAVTVTLEAGSTPGTPQPTGPTVIVLVDLNVRTGPGIQYDRVGFLLEGSQAAIIGRDPNSGWWQITCPQNITVAGSQCWVSGGSEFSEAYNTEGVPVAEIPPTPTPAPAAPEPGTGILAYTNNGRLSLITLNLNEHPTTAGEAEEVVSDSQIQAIAISPDGRRIAYVSGVFDANALHVVNLDGRGQRSLVESADLSLPAEAQNDETWALIIGNIRWLANSQTIAFNTILVNRVGVGGGPQGDLWTVALEDGDTDVVSAQAGGGTFSISPNNQRVIFSYAEEIVRANLDGSNQQALIAFDFIVTRSIVTHYPRIQWTADSSYAYLAVPSAEPFEPGAEATLWRIPAGGGAAEELNTLEGNFLFEAVHWSANGNVLAYVLDESPAAETLPRLILANGAGQNATTYAGGSEVRFLGWSGNERNFLYVTDELFGIGQIGTSPLELSLPAGEAIVEAHWLTDTEFVLLIRDTAGWRFRSGNLTGADNTLLSGGDPPQNFQFDVWTP